MYNSKYQDHEFLFEKSPDAANVSFYWYVRQVKKEIALLYEAIKTVQDAKDFFYTIRSKLHNLLTKAEQKGYDRALALVETGDKEFDSFRQRCRNNDWFYEYSDDSGIWRAGKERTEALEKFANEKGGLYLIYLNKVKKEVYNQTTT